MIVFLCLTRTDPERPSISPRAEVMVVQYDTAQHHDRIPRLYTSSFTEPPWRADWEKIPTPGPSDAGGHWPGWPGIALMGGIGLGAVFLWLTFRKKDVP